MSHYGTRNVITPQHTNTAGDIIIIRQKPAIDSIIQLAGQDPVRLSHSTDNKKDVQGNHTTDIPL